MSDDFCESVVEVIERNLQALGSLKAFFDGSREPDSDDLDDALVVAESLTSSLNHLQIAFAFGVRRGGARRRERAQPTGDWEEFLADHDELDDLKTPKVVRVDIGDGQLYEGLLRAVEVHGRPVTAKELGEVLDSMWAPRKVVAHAFGTRLYNRWAQDRSVTRDATEKPTRWGIPDEVGAA